MSNPLLPSSLYRAGQVRELDQCAIDGHGIPGYELMERAGQAAFESMQAMLGSQLSSIDTDKLQQHILVVCGGGNNGGDGYVVARYALTAGYRVHVLPLVDIDKLQGDAHTAAQHWRLCGGRDLSLNQVDFTAYDIIVDAIFGTGLQREVSGSFAAVIAQINQSQVPVLAIDIPSGLSADTGQALGDAVSADATVSFIGLKRGLFTGSAADYCGHIQFSDLSVPGAVYAGVPAEAELIQADVMQQVLPKRQRNVHKGHFGHVLIIGGAPGMSGAVQMAAMAALRTGAGLVTVATAQEHASQISAAYPEIMVHAVKGKADLLPLLERATVIALGPGLGQSAWSTELTKVAIKAEQPLIIDADGLNVLSQLPQKAYGLRRNWVLTPHPGEAGRLLDQSIVNVQQDRFAAVRQLAERYHACCILKGAGSLVGTVETPIISVCNRGHSGMATAGMGDILTGILAGLLAQSRDMFLASKAAVWLHAVAAEQLAERGERGIAATDILTEMRKVIN